MNKVHLLANILFNFPFQGVHPRLVTEGFRLAHERVMKFIDSFKVTKPVDRALLIEVAQTALRTKLDQKLADHITECVVDAVRIKLLGLNNCFFKDFVHSKRRQGHGPRLAHG